MTSIRDQEALIERARTGDPLAFGELVEPFRRILLQLAGKTMTGGITKREDASDIVQNTFLDAWQYFPSFRGTTAQAFYSWLVQICSTNARKSLVSHVRTLKRSIRREQSPESSDNRASQLDSAATSSTASKVLLRDEQDRQLWTAIAKLNDRERDAIVLHHVQGIPIKELAMRHGESEGAIIGLLTRGIRKLRRTMEEARKQ